MLVYIRHCVLGILELLATVVPSTLNPADAW